MTTNLLKDKLDIDTPDKSVLDDKFVKLQILNTKLKSNASENIRFNDSSQWHG